MTTAIPRLKEEKKEEKEERGSTIGSLSPSAYAGVLGNALTMVCSRMAYAFPAKRWKVERERNNAG
jgi:hypothetical protein